MRPRIFDLLGDNSVGKLGEVEQSHRGLIVGNLISRVDKVLEYSGSAGDRYFRVLRLHWGSGV